MGPDEDQQLAKRARMVALVVAATMLLWIGAQFLGRKIGLEARFAFLFDLAALAGFFWAAYVAIQIWRRRRED
ncbi:MAG: DUF5337 domain-containing protein [Marinosulfonomonas sp.]|nr:DUF5337 domain-containing protein [Marinosulfonomonas sp.]